MDLFPVKAESTISPSSVLEFPSDFKNKAPPLEDVADCNVLLEKLESFTNKEDGSYPPQVAPRAYNAPPSAQSSPLVWVPSKFVFSTSAALFPQRDKAPPAE